MPVKWICYFSFSSRPFRDLSLIPSFSLNISFILSLIFHRIYIYIFSLSEGAIGSGTGILLAVTIIYQYYEMFEKINADPNAFVA